MVDYHETRRIMDESHDNLGLLIDVAHLKVSANTLSFSAVDYLEAFYDSVDAYHLSDNLGFEDSNDEITECLVWPYVRNDAEYFSIEVYNESRQNFFYQSLVKQMLNKHD